jgi:outer membrane protein assembly factor BamE (lipoprotein component of BamABCDE complex)
MDWFRKIIIFVTAIAFMGMPAGCATPKIQVADAQLLLNSELAFIKDGETTREEVSLKLGVPSAQLEGDRILMYQFRTSEDGKWNLVSPIFSGNLRGWGSGTSSLVLVFDTRGILQKHSMVISK